MPDVIQFTVHGEARPAGSKTAMPCWDAKKGDYRRTKTGRIITNVLHPKTKTKEPVKDYMQRVGAAAREVYDGPLIDGPVSLKLRFFRARPKKHFGTGRNSEKVKASAPAYPVTAPDVTKLTRAVEDGLTKVLWRDDVLVRKLDVEENWGTHHYCEVTVRKLTTEDTER